MKIEITFGSEFQATMWSKVIKALKVSIEAGHDKNKVIIK